MTREEISQYALFALQRNNGGTLAIDPGVGKTKIAINFIISRESKNVIVLVPTINLIENWKKELEKWHIKPASLHSYYYVKDGQTKIVSIQFETIQGFYRKRLNNPSNYLIIADEIHTMVTDTYKQFFINNKGAIFVGLTGTPEEYKPEKSVIYKEYIPIVYRYLQMAAKDSIVNSRKYFVLRTNLSNELIHIPGWNYKVSEAEALKYYNRKLEEAGEKIQKYFDERGILDGNYFKSASNWCWLKQGTSYEKKLGFPYLKAVSERKSFVLNQNTTADLTKRIITSPICDEGVLIFSNQIEQAKKILQDERFIVHSKKKKSENDKIIFGFNEKLINCIGSCEALQMGMNFSRAKVAVFESYVGSPTKAIQKMGRVDRLPINENAIVIILYVNDSPYEGWYRKSGFPNFSDPNVTVFDDVDLLREHIKGKCL